MPERPFQLLFTAEHASNAVPARYRAVAERAGAALDTHRGYDPGTAELARRLARAFQAPLVLGRYSRLLIELNRSLHHPRLWSEFSRSLPPGQKRELIADYYQPYRDEVAGHIQRLARHGCVLHISVHSFTPELEGQVRTADIGLLYDPARRAEAAFCARWKEVLQEGGHLRVRRNYPYLGKADGLVTHLRRVFPEPVYVGVELEVNQRFPLGTAPVWRTIQTRICESLAETVATRRSVAKPGQS